jgi:hypothetical protein
LQVNPRAAHTFVGDAEMDARNDRVYNHSRPALHCQVYLRRAGHNLYQDQPAAFQAVVRAFFTGRPLPVAAWSGSAVPTDYEGPAGHPPVPGRQ